MLITRNSREPIELDKKEAIATCPHCHKNTDKVHQSHRYRVRDIPLSSWDVFLNVNRRQFRCKNCHQVFSEELSFVKKERTYSKRLAEKVLREALETRQFKNETHQPQELTEKGSSGIVRSIQQQIRPKNEAPNILT